MPSGSGGLLPKTAAVVAGAGRPDASSRLAGASTEYHPASGGDDLFARRAWQRRRLPACRVTASVEWRPCPPEDALIEVRVLSSTVAASPGGAAEYVSRALARLAGGGGSRCSPAANACSMVSCPGSGPPILVVSAVPFKNELG